MNIKNQGKLQSGKLITLASNDLQSVNSFEKPENVAPKESTIEIKKNQVALTTHANTFYIVKIAY